MINLTVKTEMVFEDWLGERARRQNKTNCCLCWNIVYVFRSPSYLQKYQVIEDIPHRLGDFFFLSLFCIKVLKSL